MKQNISESELEVMKVLWKAKKATSAEIFCFIINLPQNLQS